MKLYTKKLIFAVAFCLSLISAKAQIYSEDFDNGLCNTIFPASWTSGSTTSDWLIDDNSTTCAGAVPECTVAGSSGGSVLGGGDGSASLEAAVSASFSTLGFTSIIVDWNGFRSTGAPVTTFEYSFDDVTYTVVAFTDVTTDDAWHALTTVALPTNCDNVAKVYLRWSYTGTAAGAFIAFDDIVVSGTALTVFYWNGGAPHLTTSWGVNLDGTGANPPNFTTTNHVYNFYNNTAPSFAPTLSANWAVSGGSVFINVGNGTTRLTNLTIPATASLGISGTTLTVMNNSTLTLQHTSVPPSNLVSLSAGSTVDFGQSSVVTLYPKAYTNLTISGGASKVHGGTGTSISGILNLSSATSNYSMSASALQTMTLSGTCVGTGSLLTGNSNLVISGTGALGTLRFGTGATTRQIRNLTMNRTASGSVILGSELRVNGTCNWSNGNINLNGNSLGLNLGVTFPATSAAGALVGSSVSSFSIGGSGAITNNMHMDQTSASTRALLNLILQRTGGVTLTLDNPLEIWGSLTPTDGTYASGTNLTLKSDGSNKGRIGRIGTTGFFTGTPTVELFKSAGKTNWLNMCSSGVTGVSMTDWNSSFAITCQTCPDGWVVGTGTFTSIYTYDETAFVGDEANAAHYIEITGLTALNSKTGYWVYLGNGFPNTSAITIPLTGGVNTKGSSGAYALSLTGAAGPTNGWNLISNPYPSPISITNMLTAIGAASTTIDQTFYVYDSNTDVNTPYSASSADSIIPLGQAFSVRALSNTGFTPSEAWKVTTNKNVGLLKTNSSSTYWWDDFLLDLTSTSFPSPFKSEAYFLFDPSATTGFDNGKDAYLTGNSIYPGAPIMYSTTGGQKFLRNALPSLSGNVNIPLTVTTGSAGIFQINPVNLNKLPAGACVKLYDIGKSILHDLKTGPYTATVSANITVPQFELRITLNPATLTSNVNNPLCSNGTNGSVIAQGTTAGPWNYIWKDVSNNIIKTSINKATADTLKNIGVGSYKVDVNTTGSCDNATASFNLVSTALLPSSLFTVNDDSLSITGPTQFIFTNASTNASSYFWTFGDGNTSTAQNPSYMYANAGAYNVTLYAINSPCNDTSKYNFTLYALNFAGILSPIASDNNIKIGKDANGIYVQLNYDKSTKATVSVSNVLGQMLIAPKAIEGTTERFYIDVNTKDQLLFITVTTGDVRKTERIFSGQ